MTVDNLTNWSPPPRTNQLGDHARIAPKTPDPRFHLTIEQRGDVAHHTIELASGAKRDAVRLADARHAHIEKIYSGLELDQTDHTVWNENDLAAALFMRDYFKEALGKLPSHLKHLMAPYIEPTDRLLRSFTIDDTGHRMARTAFINLPERDCWWWCRVPDRGPIAHDLESYR